MEILSILKHQPFLFNSFDGKMDQCLCLFFSTSFFTFHSKWIKNFLKGTQSTQSTQAQSNWHVTHDEIFTWTLLVYFLSAIALYRNECFHFLSGFPPFFPLHPLPFNTYLTALLSVVIMLLLMLEFRLVHCFDAADVLSNDRFFLLHKSSLFS